MLLVLRQNHKSVGNTRSVSILFVFKGLFNVFPAIRVNKFRRSNHFSHKSVARNDVALNDFTQIVKGLTADLKTRTDCCAWQLVKFLNVDVDKVLLPKLPSERDIFLTPCRRSENEITDFCFRQFSLSTFRADIFELFVSNSSGNEPAMIFVLLVNSEVQILLVLVQNEARVNVQTSCQMLNVVVVLLQISLLAVKLNFKLAFAFACADFVDATSNDLANFDLVFKLLLTVLLKDLALIDDSVQTILQTTNYFYVSDHSGNSSCHNLSKFESSFCFVDQQVKQVLILDQVVRGPILSRIFERRSELVDDVLNHDFHVALIGHVQLLVISFRVQRVEDVGISDDLLAKTILFRFVVNVLRVHHL